MAQLTKLQVMAERAITGNQEAVDYLQLESIDVLPSDRPLNITWSKLCADYAYVAHVFVVAVQLNLQMLRRTARMSLTYMAFAARNHFKRPLPEISTTCSVQNLAETLSTILLDVPPAHLSRREDFDSDTSSEGEPQPKKPKNLHKKMKKMKKTQKIDRTRKKTGSK